MLSLAYEALATKEPILGRSNIEFSTRPASEQNHHDLHRNLVYPRRFSLEYCNDLLSPSSIIWNSCPKHGEQCLAAGGLHTFAIGPLGKAYPVTFAIGRPDLWHLRYLCHIFEGVRSKVSSMSRKQRSGNTPRSVRYEFLCRRRAPPKRATRRVVPRIAWGKTDYTKKATQ